MALWLRELVSVGREGLAGGCFGGIVVAVFSMFTSLPVFPSVFVLVSDCDARVVFGRAAWLARCASSTIFCIVGPKPLRSNSRRTSIEEPDCFPVFKSPVFDESREEGSEFRIPFSFLGKGVVPLSFFDSFASLASLGNLRISFSKLFLEVLFFEVELSREPEGKELSGRRWPELVSVSGTSGDTNSDGLGFERSVGWLGSPFRRGLAACPLLVLGATGCCDLVDGFCPDGGGSG